MVGRVKLVGLIAALLLILLPSSILAQDINFAIYPAEVRINDLPPGETAQFQLTISNNDDAPRAFTFTVSEPPKEEIREGRASLPDDSWISFCPPEITVAADSRANVTVTVAVPREPKWAGGDWETWLGVAAKSSDLLGVKLYARLLVSTSGNRSNIGLFAGIGLAVVLLGYGGYYYLRRRARSR
jgi:hypothetical protein